MLEHSKTEMMINEDIIANKNAVYCEKIKKSANKYKNDGISLIPV